MPPSSHFDAGDSPDLIIDEAGPLTPDFDEEATTPLTGESAPTVSRIQRKKLCARVFGVAVFAVATTLCVTGAILVAEKRSGAWRNNPHPADVGVPPTLADAASPTGVLWDRGDAVSRPTHEKAVTALQQSLQQCETDFGSLQEKYEQCETDFGSLQEKYDNKVKAFGLLSSTVSETETEVSRLQAEIRDLENEISDLKKRAVVVVKAATSDATTGTYFEVSPPVLQPAAGTDAAASPATPSAKDPAKKGAGKGGPPPPSKTQGKTSAAGTDAAASPATPSAKDPAKKGAGKGGPPPPSKTQGKTSAPGKAQPQSKGDALATDGSNRLFYDIDGKSHEWLPEELPLPPGHSKKPISNEISPERHEEAKTLFKDGIAKIFSGENKSDQEMWIQNASSLQNDLLTLKAIDGQLGGWVAWVATAVDDLHKRRRSTMLTEYSPLHERRFSLSLLKTVSLSRTLLTLTEFEEKERVERQGLETILGSASAMKLENLVWKYRNHEDRPFIELSKLFGETAKTRAKMPVLDLLPYVEAINAHPLHAWQFRFLSLQTEVESLRQKVGEVLPKAVIKNLTDVANLLLGKWERVCQGGPAIDLVARDLVLPALVQALFKTSQSRVLTENLILKPNDEDGDGRNTVEKINFVSAIVGRLSQNTKWKEDVKKLQLSASSDSTALQAQFWQWMAEPQVQESFKALSDAALGGKFRSKWREDIAKFGTEVASLLTKVQTLAKELSESIDGFPDTARTNLLFLVSQLQEDVSDIQQETAEGGSAVKGREGTLKDALEQWERVANTLKAPFAGADQESKRIDEILGPESKEDSKNRQGGILGVFMIFQGLSSNEEVKASASASARRHWRFAAAKTKARDRAANLAEAKPKAASQNKPQVGDRMRSSISRSTATA